VLSHRQRNRLQWLALDRGWSMTRLQVACGERTHDGFVGMDAPATGAELAHDASVFPWPLDTASVAEVLCVDYVHRTTPVGGPGDGLVAFMNEVHRVLVPDGTARIVHPHARTDRALRDPTVTRLISDQTWWFFDREWREREHVPRSPIAADFEVVSIEAPLQLDWYQRSPAAQAFALDHYWNVVGDLDVLLRARKPHGAPAPAREPVGR
jgi:hypothetical protein